MIITVLKIALPIFFTLLILPLFFRFFIGRIILILIKKQYISKFSEDKLDEADDKAAIEKLVALLFVKLSSPFIKEYDLKNEMLSVILSVQNCYLQGEDKEFQFQFSISDLIKCYFLLMSDVNSIINKTSWFGTLKKSRISTLKKINKISGYYNFLYNKIPFLKLLRKSRITGKIIRSLLIPILGLPSILLSISVSLISIFFTEIIWKYYYSILLVKCTYYAMILYGHKNSIIKGKIEKFPSFKIKEMADSIEEIINPENTIFRSEYFEKSYIEYQRILEEFGIGAEKDLDFDGIKYRFNKKRRVFKRVFEVPINVVKHYNPFYEKSYSEKARILDMITRIASVYSVDQNIYDDLRVLDVFEVLYMISVLLYKNLLFSSKVLDNLSVDFILRAKDLSNEIFDEILKNKLSIFKRVYRSYTLIRKSRVLYKAVRSSNAIGLIFSFTGPIAFEGIKIQLKDYFYQRIGRLTLYCFESNKLKKDNIFYIPDDL